MLVGDLSEIKLLEDGSDKNENQLNVMRVGNQEDSPTQILINENFLKVVEIKDLDKSKSDMSLLREDSSSLLMELPSHRQVRQVDMHMRETTKSLLHNLRDLRS